MRQTFQFVAGSATAFFVGNDKLKFVVHGKADALYSYFALEVL